MDYITKNKIVLDDKIFRFIYIEAIKDAVSQLAYKGDKKWLKELDVLNSIKSEVEVLIDKVLNNEYLSQAEYDEDFLCITINVCKCINGKSENANFTFGNAQKLINIMLKYFYITSYKKYSSKEKFRFCHCPMDKQLLKDIWSKREELDCCVNLGNYDYFLKSWGSEDFEIDENGKKGYPKRYILFQQAVHFFADKENINSLEYDYYIW